MQPGGFPQPTGVTNITSTDNSITITTPKGPTTNLAVASPPFLQDPTVLRIETYDAKGDGKLGTTGTTTNNSAVFNDANATFTSADVGKQFVLSCGGALGAGGGTDLVTTIISFQSATQVTLGANATTGNKTVFTGTGYYTYGTDDTAAFQSAINAATQLAAIGAPTGSGNKWVIQLESAIYILAGALVQTGHYNCQIQLPIISVTTAYELGIELRGRTEDILLDGGQAPPQGTVLFSTLATGEAYGTTHGAPSVFGAQATQRTGSAFSFIQPVFNGITFMGPSYPYAFFLDLGWCDQARVQNCNFTKNQPYTSYNTDGWTNSGGVIMPQTNNNNRSLLINNSFNGMFAGVVDGEHTIASENNSFFQCNVAIASMTVTNQYNETAYWTYASIVNCIYGVGSINFGTGVVSPTRIVLRSLGMVDLEDASAGGFQTTDHILDANNKIMGSFSYVRDKAGPQNGITVSGATGVQQYDLNTGVPTFTHGTDTSGAAAFTTAAPTSGVAFTPLATSDATVYIPVIATTAGTVKITMGASTGAENPVVPVSNMVAQSEPTFTLLVPKNWKVIVTITGVTTAIGTVNIQAC